MSGNCGDCDSSDKTQMKGSSSDGVVMVDAESRFEHREKEEEVITTTTAGEKGSGCTGGCKCPHPCTCNDCPCK